MCNSGVYIVRFDQSCIKIGRSKDIARRLKQYAGYRGQAQQVEKILLVFTPEYVELEKVSHKFAEDFGLPRYKPYEVFECAVGRTEEFISEYRSFIEVNHSDFIHSIADTFEPEQPCELYIAPPISNALPMPRLRSMKLTDKNNSDESSTSERVSSGECLQAENSPLRCIDALLSGYRYKPSQCKQVKSESPALVEQEQQSE